MMDKIDMKYGYEQIIIADNALATLHNALHQATAGAGLGIPSNWRGYVAQLRLWIMEEKAMLEKELEL